MKGEIVIYHGSQQCVSKPLHGYGKLHNDYGRGFYCTEEKELAREWACPVKRDGYCNTYRLRTAGLRLMYLTRGEFNILNWLAILLVNRTFDISSPIGSRAKEHIVSRFMPDTSRADVLIGYRADDSYFAFAEDFINNSLSLRSLARAMRLGKLGEQVVLLSERSFEQLEFVECELVDCVEYYRKRTKRDSEARAAYASERQSTQQFLDDIFVLDIIREDMRHDDPRLQSVISG